MPAWMPPDLVLLDTRCPLPLDRPFTRHQAIQAGVSRWQLARLVERGLVRQLLHGVFAAAQVSDCLELRAAALSMIVSDACIVTDRTAAWLHGVDILPRSSLVAMPPLQVYNRAGSRLRRAGVSSGTRQLTDSDVMVVNGVLVTTKLRTALDLGRSLWRFDALAALDGFLAAGVEHEELLSQVERFKGDRGVVQLRTLAPLADGRSESPAESALRLHWIEAALPAPDLQIWVHDDFGRERFRVDIGLEVITYGAEFDGEEFHGPERQAYDEDRRTWLREERGWTIDVFRKGELYAPGSDPGPRLRAGFEAARRRHGAWSRR